MNINRKLLQLIEILLWNCKNSLTFLNNNSINFDYTEKGKERYIQKGVLISYISMWLVICVDCCIYVAWFIKFIYFLIVANLLHLFFCVLLRLMLF